ncbi:hypothetical protein BDY19DRAFT_955729 [Irpex rosettiformis]|uniref:Uncharacterized protein n=1 Tax=Irpex rosettiformis TaxID=378272 RepID=A0ACB8TZI0_9APHY|nr:hypothetical protein BDY19DRAFT_955729 [Irpex rosettiformis]
MDTPIPNNVADDNVSSVDALTGTQRSVLPDTYPQVEDALWEDEPDYNLTDAPAFAHKPVRKRKSASKKIFLAQSSPTLRKFTTKNKDNIKEDVPPLITIDRNRVRREIQDGAAFTWQYVFDVVGTALHLLRKPLAGLLFVYIFAFLLTQVSSAFRTAFAPICWVPFISRSPLCRTIPPSPNVPRWADYPKLVETESSTFEKLLDESVENAGLSLDIKKAEMATSDLVTLVKFSHLKSKDRLAEHLETFIDDSKKTGRALQRLSSRVNGAVDSVTAVNEHALQTIQDAQSLKTSLSFTSLILWPISKGVVTQTVVADTFVDAMSVLETQISRIRLEAEAAAMHLNNLEQSLVTMHELLIRENFTLTKEKEELLAELWTKIGGNRKKLKGVNNHLQLLVHMGDWRKRAQVYVVATMQALDAMSEDMEDLRERVAKPELIGESVPPEVHMKSIQAGLERLKVDRRRAKEREEDSLRRVLILDGIED